MVKKFLSLILTITMVIGMIHVTEESAEADTFDVAMRFVVASDIHMRTASDERGQRLAKMFDTAYAYSASQNYNKLDAVVLVGDITDHGYDSEYTEFESVITKSLKSETTLLMTMGNHEWWPKDNRDQSDERYLECASKFGLGLNWSKDIKGYQFIGMSPLEDDTYGDDNIAWMQDAVNDAVNKDETKPVFTFQHHNIADTVLGSFSSGSIPGNGESKKLKQAYNHNQVINFSGHSHAPINAPTSIAQTTFTQCTTGTLYYFDIDNSATYGAQPPNSNNAAQYTIVEVSEDNKVRMLPYNLYEEKFFSTPSTLDGDAQLIRNVDVNNAEEWQYTEQRKNIDASPYFENDVKPSFDYITHKSAQISFKQAQDDSGVYAYDIICTPKNGEVKKYRIFSEWYFDPIPETLSYNLTNLSPETDYMVEVIPVDFFGNVGSAISSEFKTVSASDAGIVLALDNVSSDNTWWFTVNQSDMLVGEYYKAEAIIDGMECEIVFSVQSNGKVCIWPNFFEIYNGRKPTKSFRVKEDTELIEVSSSKWAEIENGDRATISKGFYYKNEDSGWTEAVPEEDNLMVNGDFTNSDGTIDLTGWNDIVESQGEVIMEKSSVYSCDFENNENYTNADIVEEDGNHYAKYILRNENQYIGQSFQATIGTKYKVYVRMKTVESVDGYNLGFRIQGHNSGSDYADMINLAAITSTTDGWKEFSTEFTADRTNYDMHVYAWGESQTFLIDDVDIYTESPKKVEVKKHVYQNDLESDSYNGATMKMDSNNRFAEYTLQNSSGNVYTGKDINTVIGTTYKVKFKMRSSMSGNYGIALQYQDYETSGWDTENIYKTSATNDWEEVTGEFTARATTYNIMFFVWGNEVTFDVDDIEIYTSEFKIETGDITEGVGAFGHDGGNALMVDKSTNIYNYATVDNMISGNKYNYSFWIKIEGAESDFEFIPYVDNCAGGFATIEGYRNEDTPWTMISGSFVAPEKSEQAGIRIGFERRGTGRVYVDDFVLTKDNTEEETTVEETTVELTTTEEITVAPTTTEETTVAPTTTEETTVAPTTTEETTVAPTTTEETTVAPTTTEKITVVPTTTKTISVKKPSKVKINVVSKKKKNSPKVKLSWKKAKAAKAYQVCIYASKNNAKTNKRAIIKKISTKVKLTIVSKKLKNKKSLYIKIRAYNVGTDRKRVYGNWSEIRKIRIKK